MLLRTPEMLKKSGINNALNTVPSPVPLQLPSSNSPLFMTQSAVKKSLHLLWSVEGISLSYRLISPPKQYIFIFRADTNLFLSNSIFENLILRIFLIIIVIIRCFGMFHVPSFIDRHFKILIHTGLLARSLTHERKSKTFVSSSKCCIH